MSAHRFLHLLDIGILADIGHGVQQAPYREPIISGQTLLTEQWWRVAGFFAVGLAGFFADDGDAGVSSTTTGLGRNLGGSPVDVIASRRSVSGW